MQVQGENRLAEIQRFTQLANIQCTEVPNRCRANHFKVAQCHLGNSPSFMKGNKVLPQRFNKLAAHSRPPTIFLIPMPG